MLLVVKNLLAIAEDARDTDLIPGLGRSSRVGNDCPLQYSCLENSMDRGVYSSWDCNKSDMTEQLTHSLFTFQGFTEQESESETHSVMFDSL